MVDINDELNKQLTISNRTQGVRAAFTKVEYKPWNEEGTTQQSGQLLEEWAKDIVRWQYKDRPENELGDIEDLAESIKLYGQQQPCIVRPSRIEGFKYELIIGERRWHACMLAGVKLKIIVRDMDDREAAIVQAIENEKRSDLSDYARGMSYADKIEKGILKQQDLVDILKISKKQVSRLLSYRKIPETLAKAIGDFRKVSARTADELVRYSTLDVHNIDALIKQAEHIREGKFGSKKIENYILKTEQDEEKNYIALEEEHKKDFKLELYKDEQITIRLSNDVIRFFTDTRSGEEATQKIVNFIREEIKLLDEEAIKRNEIS